jgi:hypothetical protein
MNRVTEWKLKKLAKRSGPSAAFRSRLRQRLCEADPAAFGRAARQGWRVVAGSACAIVLALGTTTGVYAYQSPDVVEGTTLFPIKHGIERAQEALAVTPEAKAEVHATLLERRVNEAETHAADAPVREQLMHDAEAEIRTTEHEAKDEVKDPETRGRLLDRVKEQRDRYEKLKERVGTEEHNH